ncbi:MAG: F0F1 ATP synthase subunit delta [Dehalococcoidia bacterium]|nr:F0F1 ATP synthase subunit delta [Dehalococcoidia bacterium]
MKPRLNTSSRRYARAVMEIALEKRQLEFWRNALQKLAQVMQETETHSVLCNPRVPLPLKKQLLEERLQDQGQMVINLAWLLTTRGKTYLAGQIAADYEDMLNRHYGLQPAEVIAAVPLDDATKEKLDKYLSEVAGKKVLISTKIDPAIIGGVVARIGDQLIDGTVRSALDRLKRTLA